MRIYTKYGDDGKTQLLGGQQTRKSDIRIEVCGTLDELNAALGVVASHFELPERWPPDLQARFIRVQSNLFSVGALIASVGAESKMNLPTIDSAHTRQLEKEIDAMQMELKPLQNFLLPGGVPAAAAMHLARAVCRRSERLFTAMVDQFPDFPEAKPVFTYLNRLSDWCFVVARYMNKHAGVDEPVWQSGGQ